MKLDYDCKKTFTVFILVVTSMCLVFPANVLAELTVYEDDGVAFDLFEDTKSVILENCTLNGESITLTSEPLSIIYNHKKKPDNMEVWKFESIYLSEGPLLKLLSSLIKPDILPGEEVKQLYGINVEDDNNVVVAHSYFQPYRNRTCSPMTLFRFKIDEEIDLIDKISVYWQSGNYQETDNLEKITMYIWSYGDLLPRWNYIHSIVYDENVTYPKGGIKEKIDGNRYTGKEGEIDILIVGTPSNLTGEYLRSKLRSDYIEVKLDIKEGYKSEGYVISDTIIPTPSKFEGWENIFWEGTKPSNNSNIKIQVLDQNNILIDSLEGNSDGFSTSPIDLSSIGTDYVKIRMKALLTSDNPQFTPSLYSWGVLWRTIDGFYDNFTYDYRLDETVGVDRENNNLILSKFYSEWPIFGKTSSNARSYIGPNPNIQKNETYWTTSFFKDIGGWFRSPVMKDGKIYIASNDKTISVFNLSREKNTTIQNQIDVSKKSYYVESSLAIGTNSLNEELVIFATSELDNNSNSVYALEASNLSNVSWKSVNWSSPICFSSAPTIANGNVYVTSWSGKYANVPQIYYMFSRLNTMLGNTFGFNNYLFGFELDNGNRVIWDNNPISLPAGSFSTPAVDNGIIFVGCENIRGPSLLAFDENNGNLIWNVSVGMVGRSSPVIAESENGKIVIVLSRNQDILSFSGEDKIFALRAETGEMLWNRTLSNDSTFLRANLLKSIFNFHNQIAISEPASTPAVYGDTVFVMAPNGTLLALNVETGEMIWSYNLKKSLGGQFTSYYCSSPAVVGNTVYICSQSNDVIAIDADTGKLIISYDVKFEGLTIQPLLYYYSSPIVTDGVVITSATEPRGGSSSRGHLISLGNYQPNSIGNVYSTPIHVQKGKWWNIFNATYNTSENGSITFSILDNDGNIIINNLNGSNNDISDSDKINSGIIQLCATLKTTDVNPILHNWKVTFKSETVKPIFNESSFTPDPGGWINTNKPVCTIKVYDQFPGLDVTSAKYRLVYEDNEKSNWYDAECTGKNGTKTNQTVTADATEIEPDKEVKRIEISISDLSGNKAVYELADDFKLDTLAPSSFIETKLLSGYNEPFIIKANGTDKGENKSGIKTISLYYKKEGDENFTKYGSSESPFEWEFDTDISSIIDICTIAKDRAGNSEDFPEEVENTFIYDKIEPAKPDIENLYHFAKLPEFSIEFTDDYLLKDVEYRLNFRGEWIKLNQEDINSNSYTGEWTLNKSDWDYIENDVIYQIYFRITDMAGNQYQTPDDTEALAIIKDTIPPGTKIDLDLSDLEGGGWKDSYTINAYIPYDEDIEYVTLEYRYSPDNDKWSKWITYGGSQNNSVYEWKFNAEDGSGYYEFKVKVWDYAGNYVESIPEKVSLTLIQTNLIILFIALFIIFIILTKFITVKINKKRQ